jgi:hypothetical protein
VRDEVGGKRRLVDAQNDPICVRADVKTARTPPRQNDGYGVPPRSIDAGQSDIP